MNAKEMFEELGYERKYDDIVTYELLYHFINGVGCYIVFNNGTVFAVGLNEQQKFSDDWVVITKEVYQAITQQMKELGWLDE